MGNHTLFMIVSIVLVLGIFSSTAFIANAVPASQYSQKCIKYYHSETGGLLLQRCCYKSYVDGKLTANNCNCNDASGETVKCPKWTDGDFKDYARTFNPGFKDDANAGVLQDENINNTGKDTNIDNDAGVSKESTAINSGNDTITIPKESGEKSGVTNR